MGEFEFWMSRKKKKKTHKIAFTSKPKKKEKKEPRALVRRLGLNLLSPTFYNIRL